MADAEKTLQAQDASVAEHGYDEKKHQVATIDNVDSLGHVGAVREADESDYVTWKTWCVIVVSGTYQGETRTGRLTLLPKNRSSRRRLASPSGPFQPPLQCKARLLQS